MPIVNEMMDVTIILKETQKQPNNKYTFTYNGVPTLSDTKSVTTRVAWSQQAFTDIVNSLVITEIENINMVSALIDDAQAYYVPALSDVGIGYVYEKYVPTSSQRYELVTFDINDMQNIETLVEDAGMGKIRVPYLTRPHIEAAGWTYVSTTSGVLKFTKTTNLAAASTYYGATVTSMEITFKPANQECKITYYIQGGSSFIMFFGQCKSYNELIKVMHLIKAT